MNDNSLTKVDRAAAVLIGKFEITTSPFLSALRHLDELQPDPTWDARELLELRLQVIRGLLASQTRRAKVPSMPPVIRDRDGA